MTKPIITKEHFVACINVLQEGDDMARRINRVVHEYMDMLFLILLQKLN